MSSFGSGLQSAANTRPVRRVKWVSSMAKPTDEAAAASSPRHVLPWVLPNAVKHLDDGELDRLLLAVVLAEAKRRGEQALPDGKPPQGGDRSLSRSR